MEGRTVREETKKEKEVGKRQLQRGYKKAGKEERKDRLDKIR